MDVWNYPIYILKIKNASDNLRTVQTPVVTDKIWGAAQTTPRHKEGVVQTVSLHT